METNIPILNFFRLIRVANLILLAITQYFVRIFLIGPSQNWKSILADRHFFLLSLATTLIAAAGYIINDYYDLKIDNVNKPYRVVIGKSLKRRSALFIHSLINFTAVCIGFLLGLKIGLIIFTSAFFMWLYSNNLKRLPFIGNVIVALFTSISLCLVAFYYHRSETIIYMYAGFAFFISLIREIIKDMEDLKGDASFGCRTLPIIWGPRKTKVFLFILIFLLGVLLFLSEKNLNHIIHIYFLALIFPLICFLTYKLIKADMVKDFKQLSSLCKLIMLAGIISMVFI